MSEQIPLPQIELAPELSVHSTSGPECEQLGSLWLDGDQADLRQREVETRRIVRAKMLRPEHPAPLKSTLHESALDDSARHDSAPYKSVTYTSAIEAVVVEAEVQCKRAIESYQSEAKASLSEAISKSYATTNLQLVEALNNFHLERRAFAERIQPLLLEMVVEIAAAVIGDSLGTDTQAIAKRLERALQQIASTEGIQIFVNSHDAAALRSALADELSNAVTASALIPAGDIQIKLGTSKITLSLDEHLNEIEHALADDPSLYQLIQEVWDGSNKA
jgi:flagellar biosynthesis/type III secretory pathway protein FliH